MFLDSHVSSYLQIHVVLGDVKRARGSRPQVANCCSAGAVGGRIGMVSFLMSVKSRILGDVPVIQFFLYCAY